jgi:hypothetical protein
MEELLFTPAALLDILVKIDELQDYDIGITETLDGILQLVIGDSIYELSVDDAVDIQVDEGVIETIDDTNMSAYEELADSGEIDLADDVIQFDKTVESGIIKEVAKTLLVGGMVRLTGKLLQKK